MEKFNPSYSLTEFKQSDFMITATVKKTATDFKFTQNVISEFTLLSFKEK